MSRQPADHGKNFVPGGEAAPNLAPQSLDHFKRGYRERADQRDRDTEFLSNDFDIRRSSNQNRTGGGGSGSGSFSDYQSVGSRNSSGRYSNHSGSYSDRSSRGSAGDGGSYHGRASNRDSQMSNYSQMSNSSRGSFGRGRGGSWAGRGDRRGSDRGDGRPQVIMGLDIQAVVDRISRRDVNVFQELDATREGNLAVFQSGKAVTAIISNLARRRNLRLACVVWDWMDSIGEAKNTFHYNSMISVCEKVRDHNKALRLLDEMREKGVEKNEVTFSSAISACEKCGQWRIALDLLDQMKREGAGQTAIAYNAAISACEKGLVPQKAMDVFTQMKAAGVRPTVVTYSALISAAEKGGQWKLALDVLTEMRQAGHGANVIAYSAAISALSKGQNWQKALELFREIEASGGKPSIVTYNATMTALEKGLQWERALDLFDEMKTRNMPVTVVSYGSAISACEKGLQYRQCLEYLDEMTEMGIKKNVIIFGAAMSCMEKSCRADIAFQLMDRMKLEGVAPNVHIYNSAISACARCKLWEKGYELFQEMEAVGVARDVVTYNAVLDAVSSQVQLGRRLFKEGVEKGFYARVSRLGTQWLELDLHFLSLGGGEIALGWWFEECLVPYLVNTSKLEAVQSISIVTGYGKTRSRGARLNDDGMRLRVKAMLEYMEIFETPQPNKGRIHIDKEHLIEVVEKNGGKIVFDVSGYTEFKQEQTTENKIPDVHQTVRPRFRPAKRGEGPQGTFIREGGDSTQSSAYEREELRRDGPTQTPFHVERRESRRSSQMSMNDDRGPRDSGWNNERRGSRHEWSNQGDGWPSRDRRPSYNDQGRRGGYNPDRGSLSRGYSDYQDQRGHMDNRRGSDDHDYAVRGMDLDDRPSVRDWPDRARSEFDRERRGSRYNDFDGYGDHRNSPPRPEGSPRNFQRDPDRDYFRSPTRNTAPVDEFGRVGPTRDYGIPPRRASEQDATGDRRFNHDRGYPNMVDRSVKRQRHSVQFGESSRGHVKRPKRVSDSVLYLGARSGFDSETLREFSTIDEDPDPFRNDEDDPLQQRTNGSIAGAPKPAGNRGYSIEPSYNKRRSA